MAGNARLGARLLRPLGTSLAQERRTDRAHSHRRGQPEDPAHIAGRRTATICLQFGAVTDRHSVSPSVSQFLISLFRGARGPRPRQAIRIVRRQSAVAYVVGIMFRRGSSAGSDIGLSHLPVAELDDSPLAGGRLGGSRQRTGNERTRPPRPTAWDRHPPTAQAQVCRDRLTGGRNGLRPRADPGQGVQRLRRRLRVSSFCPLARSPVLLPLPSLSGRPGDVAAARREPPARSGQTVLWYPRRGLTMAKPTAAPRHLRSLRATKLGSVVLAPFLLAGASWLAPERAPYALVGHSFPALAA